MRMLGVILIAVGFGAAGVGFLLSADNPMGTYSLRPLIIWGLVGIAGIVIVATTRKGNDKES